MMDKTIAIWFSRHDMTPEQRQEILGKHNEILERKDLASREILTMDDADAIWLSIQQDCIKLRVTGFYGVVPSPLRSIFYLNSDDVYSDSRIFIPVFEAWNVKRAPENGASTFVHNGFRLTGHFYA